MYKKVILSILFSLVSLNVSAESISPKINFTGGKHFGDWATCANYNPPLATKSDDTVSPCIFSHASFERYLGMTKNNLEKILDRVLNYDKRSKETSKYYLTLNDYSLIIYEDKSKVTNANPIYIFKDNVCIGYYIISDFVIIKNYDNNDVILKIKQLNKQNDYIGNYVMPNNIVIDIYKDAYDNYVEQYVILNDRILFLDAFYPQDLEGYFKTLFNKKIRNINRTKW